MPSFISGVSSTLKNRTFPSIRIVGYRGRAKVIVSCVTEDEPYRWVFMVGTVHFELIFMTTTHFQDTSTRFNWTRTIREWCLHSNN